MFSSTSIRLVAAMAFVLPTITACSTISEHVSEHALSIPFGGPGIKIAVQKNEKIDSDSGHVGGGKVASQGGQVFEINGAIVDDSMLVGATRLNISGP